MEEIERAATKPWKAVCNWFTPALELLFLNGIDPIMFSSAIRTALIKGCRKCNNNLLTVPTSCDKIFLLIPLKIVHEQPLFENPSNYTSGWVSNTTVILLQGFRWNKDSIQWKDLFLLLEGEFIKLPGPKKMYVEDVVIDWNVAIFATSKSPIGPTRRCQVICWWQLF